MNLHLNPYGRNHGTTPSFERHMGDIGNITSDSTSTILHQGVYNLLTFTGSVNIIGRGVVLHTLRDDGNPLNQSNSVGAAGGRIARCVIGVSNRVPPLDYVPPSSSGTTGTTSMGSSSTGSMGSSSTGTTTGSTGVNSAIRSSVTSAAIFTVIFAAIFRAIFA